MCSVKAEWVALCIVNVFLYREEGFKGACSDQGGVLHLPVLMNSFILQLFFKHMKILVSEVESQCVKYVG